MAQQARFVDAVVTPIRAGNVSALSEGAVCERQGSGALSSTARFPVVRSRLTEQAICRQLPVPVQLRFLPPSGNSVYVARYCGHARHQGTGKFLARWVVLAVPGDRPSWVRDPDRFEIVLSSTLKLPTAALLGANRTPIETTQRKSHCGIDWDR